MQLAIVVLRQPTNLCPFRAKLLFDCVLQSIQLRGRFGTRGRNFPFVHLAQNPDDFLKRRLFLDRFEESSC